MWSRGPGEKGGGVHKCPVFAPKSTRVCFTFTARPPLFCFLSLFFLCFSFFFRSTILFKLLGEGSRVAGRRLLARLSVLVRVLAGSVLRPGPVAAVAAPVDSGCPLRCHCRCAASLPLGSPSGCWSLLGY